MIRRPTLDALTAFAVFAERLNFTHAAEELNISQPALFMKIQDLSESLEISLYRKIGRRLELTEQGKRVARLSRELNALTDDFFQEIHSGYASNPVVLAAGEGAFLYLLGDAIKEFKKRSKHPLKLLTMNRETMIEAIRAGKAHLGVATIETIPDGFEAKLLCKVDQVVVMPKSDRLENKRSLRLNDLNHKALIVPPSDRPHRQMLATALQSEGVSWSVAVEASGWELMLHFVKLGLGYAVVNSSCTIPRGLVARKLPQLPQVYYQLLQLKGAAKAGPQAQLKELLLTTVPAQTKRSAS